MKNRRAPSLLTVIIALILLGYYIWQANSKSPAPAQPATQPGTSSSSGSLGQRTKTSGCFSQNALPDPDCTPGAVFSNVTVDQICQSGYSSSVRNVSESTKNEVFSEYGIATHSPGEYEVDHLISLELGGSNEIANLWAEPAEPRPGFHEKDKVENYLHTQICNGTMSLKDAQYQIAHDWMTVYQTLQNK